MCIRSLIGSCLSCFVKAITPSALVLFNICVCPWLQAPCSLVSLCECVCVCVRELGQTCMCVRILIYFVLNLVLVYYSGRKQWQYHNLLLRKNVNVSLLLVLLTYFYQSNPMYVETCCVYSHKGSPAMWWLCCMFRGPYMCDNNVMKYLPNKCPVENVGNWKCRGCRLCCFSTCIQ